MGQAVQLDVPLIVEADVGYNWEQAHSFSAAVLVLILPKYRVQKENHKAPLGGFFLSCQLKKS